MPQYGVLFYLVSVPLTSKAIVLDVYFNEEFFSEVLQSGRAFQLRSDSSSTEGFFMCRAVNEYGNIQYKFKVSVTCE